MNASTSARVTSVVPFKCRALYYDRANSVGLDTRPSSLTAPEPTHSMPLDELTGRRAVLLKTFCGLAFAAGLACAQSGWAQAAKNDYSNPNSWLCRSGAHSS